MRLNTEKLDTHLHKALHPLYLLSGDEPLQREESLDLIRAAARAKGYEERTVIHAERGFDGAVLREFGDSLSLFANLRIVEVRIERKLEDKGRKALVDYAAKLPDDTISLIVFGFRIDGAAARSKWFSSLEKHAMHIPAQQINSVGMPAWVRRRALQRSLHLEEDALTVLAERGEGNLLACAQEIETLSLLYPQQTVTVTQVLEATRDSARYDAFNLVDACFAGQAAKAVRILRVLREEGHVIPEIIGALAWALRSAGEVAAAIAQGTSLERALGPRQGAWRSGAKLELMRAATQRHPAWRWGRFIQRAGSVERRSKGHIGRLNSGIPHPAMEAWSELESLILALCGVRPASKRTPTG